MVGSSRWTLSSGAILCSAWTFTSSRSSKWHWGWWSMSSRSWSSLYVLSPISWTRAWMFVILAWCNVLVGWWYSMDVACHGRCLQADVGIAMSWMASMPTVLVQELWGKELQFGLMAVILVCITGFLALMIRNWMSSQWVKPCQTLQMTRLKKRCASRM